MRATGGAEAKRGTELHAEGRRITSPRSTRPTPKRSPACLPPQRQGSRFQNWIKQHPFCKSGLSEVGHLASMVR
jgi:hypothetical protein